ncbi:MAG: catalase, partial [Bermanella sp.]
MKHNLITSSIITFFLIACTVTNSIAATNDKEIQANDFVELFEKLGGKHPGHRK